MHDDPEIDELAHLRRQHGLLTERSDRRFAANFEPKAAGLTAYIRDAINANAGRH